MESILERYQRCSLAETQLAPNDSEQQENWCLEYPQLMARIEALQRSLRNFTGEDLDPLSLRELQHLEQQIDTALKRVRSRKNQLYHESLSNLQKEEKSLHEQNNMLVKQLKENEKTLAEKEQWEQQNLSPRSSAFMPLPPPLPLRPMVSLPSLTVGGNLQTREFMSKSNQEEAIAQAQPNTNTMQMPPWMLRHHVNE